MRIIMSLAVTAFLTVITFNAQANHGGLTANFASGSAALTSDAHAVIAKAAEQLRGTSTIKKGAPWRHRNQHSKILGGGSSTVGKTARIVGHTDTVADTGYNITLSQKRADAVKNALIALGIDASQLETEAKGESSPYIQTGDNVAEPKNRRVKIIIE